LDPLLRALEMADDVGDEVLAVRVLHGLPVQGPDLHEVDVAERVGVPGCHPRQVNGREDEAGVRSGAAEAVRPVVGPAASVPVEAHGAGFRTWRRPRAPGRR